MAFSLSQIDRKARTYTVSTLLGGAVVPPSGSVGLGLVPKYAQSPTAATVWTPVTYTSGSFSVLFAGPQADSTGAIVVTADADLWMLETDAPLVQAVKIERITVLGSSAVLPSLPSTYVTSVNGKSGVTALTFSDVGADAAGAATAAQAAAIAAIPSMSTIAADAALRAAYVTYLILAGTPDSIIAGTITRDANGAATSAPVVWPDGSPGTYTADTVSTTFPGAVDAYHITYGSPVTKTYTQAAVTRDAATGAVTQRPALTVA